MAAVSILPMVAVTFFLVGISFAVHTHPFNRLDVIVLLWLTGAGAPLFFFAVRDVNASVICVAGATVPIVSEEIDLVVTGAFMPFIYRAALPVA